MTEGGETFFCFGC